MNVQKNVQTSDDHTNRGQCKKYIRVWRLWSAENGHLVFIIGEQLD